MSRLTIETSDEIDVDIRRTARGLGVDTTDKGVMTAEVIRRALGFNFFCVEEIKQGGRLIIENPGWNHRKEILL